MIYLRYIAGAFLLAISTIAVSSEDQPIHISIINSSYDSNIQANESFATLQSLIGEIYTEGEFSEFNFVNVTNQAGTGDGTLGDIAAQWFASANFIDDQLEFLGIILEEDNLPSLLRDGVTAVGGAQLINDTRSYSSLGFDALDFQFLSRADYARFGRVATNLFGSLTSFIASEADPDVEEYLRAYRKIRRNPDECLIVVAVGSGVKDSTKISTEIFGSPPPYAFNTDRYQVLHLDDRFLSVAYGGAPISIFPEFGDTTLSSFISENEDDIGTLKTTILNTLRVMIETAQSRCGFRITEDTLFSGGTLFDNGPEVPMDLSIPWAGYAEFPFRMIGEIIECNVPFIPFLGGGCRSGVREVSPAFLAPLESQPFLLEGIEICGPPRAQNTPGWSYTARYYLEDARGVTTNTTDVTFQCHLEG